MSRKFRKLLILIIISTLSIGSAQITHECPRDWVEKNEQCYYFVNKPPKTVQEATIYCEEVQSATLLSIKSEAEHKFMQEWLRTFNDSRSIEWLTSGVKKGSKLKWESDGSDVTERYFPSEEIEKKLYKDPVSEIVNNRIVYKLYKDDNQYLWGWSRVMKASSFVCQMAKEDTWRFHQKKRDFSFGNTNTDPTKWPLGPKFRTEPENTIFFKHSDAYTPVLLECDASGNPNPTYEWFRLLQNGKRAQVKSNKQYSITNGVLYINNPNPDDNVGAYVCEANNKYGKIISNQVQLSYGYVGEFPNIETSPYIGVQYQGLELDCKPPSLKPEAIITWFKDGIRHFIRTKYNPHMFLSKNGRFYFSQVSPADAGPYYCQVVLTPRPGEKLALLQPPMVNSKRIILRVEGENANTYGPDIHNKFPQVFPKPPQVGQHMEIECLAYGRLPLMYKWKRLDAKMNPDHSTTDHGRRLIIPNPRLEDSGLYSCIVTGLQDTVHKNIYVKMSQLPEFPYPLQDQHPDIGFELTWSCNAISIPLPVYSWYKDGTLLTNDNTLGIKIQRNRLYFSKIDPAKHDGVYQCQASVDRLTWRRTSAQLRAVAFKPTFVKNPLVKSFVASRNGNLTIKCQPEASPRPEITWTHNGGSLSASARVLSNFALELSALHLGDQGTYTCTATNIHGVASSSTILSVFDYTVLTEQPSDEKIRQNGTVSLGCKVSFNANDMDLVYSWKFNDHTIDFSKEVAYSTPYIDRLDGTLYISDIQFEHEGEYTCEVVSTVNTVKTSGYVSVLGPPSEPAGVHVNKVKGNTMDVWWQVPGEIHGGIVRKYSIQVISALENNVTKLIQGIDAQSTRLENYPGWCSYIVEEGLSPGSRFYFRVTAANEYGYGGYSLPSEKKKTDDAAPIHAPPDVDGGGGSEMTLSITWTELRRIQWGSASVSYNVYYRRLNENENWQGKTGVKKPPFHVTISEDLYYMPYEVKVQAQNTIGAGPNSTVKIVYSAEKMPELAPTDVSTNGLNTTAGYINWTPLPANRKAMGGRVFAYQLNYYYESDTKCPLRKEYTAQFIRIYGQASEGLLVGLTPGSYVCVTVQFMNHAGLGPKTDAYSMGLSHYAPSLYPQSVAVMSHGSHSVRVTWQGVLTNQDEESVTGYKAWIWGTGEHMEAARIIDFGKVYTAIIDNVQNDKIYKLRLLAYSGGGDGNKSPTTYFTLGGMLLVDSSRMDIMNTGPSVMLTSPQSVLVMMLFSILSQLIY